MSKIEGIFWSFFLLDNINLGDYILLNTFFSSVNFWTTDYALAKKLAEKMLDRLYSSYSYTLAITYPSFTYIEWVINERVKGNIWRHLHFFHCFCQTKNNVLQAAKKWHVPLRLEKKELVTTNYKLERYTSLELLINIKKMILKLYYNNKLLTKIYFEY